MNIPAASFQKAERITHAKEFREVFKKGSACHKNGISVYCVRNKISRPRLGMVISRKALRRAVDRNRYKRIFREFFRKEKHNMKQSYDIVIRLNYDCNILKSDELRKNTKYIFKDARLLD